MFIRLKNQTDKDRAIVTILTLMSTMCEHPEFDSHFKAELTHLFKFVHNVKIQKETTTIKEKKNV